MSEAIQFERHPDADQISAFVEHALPAHEREQMLDHLAMCPDCREIVALSLPELSLPERAERLAARRQHAAARTPWWMGWTLAWPVAGALAAVVLSVVYIHHVAKAPNGQEQQVALAPSAAPPALQNQPATPTAQPSGSKTQAPPASGPATSTRQASAATGPDHEAVGAGQSIGGQMLKGQNLDALRAVPSPAAAMGNLFAAKKVAPTTNRDFHGTAEGIAKTPLAAEGARSAEMDSTQLATKASPSAQSAPAATPMPAAGGSLVVTNAVTVETTNANVATLGMVGSEKEAAQLKRPFPSGLPVLSMARQDQRIVAIDTGHAIFVSKDGGKHWKTVQAPWTGQAVRASLVEVPVSLGVVSGIQKRVAKVHADESDTAPALKSSNTVIPQAPPPSAEKGASLTGTVTDTTGAAIGGATIIVTGTVPGTTRSVKSDGAGHYRFEGLAPGSYRVQAQPAGFERRTIDNVAVTASGPNIANLSLNVGAASETVSVMAAGAPISTEGDTSAYSISSSRPGPIFEIVTDNGEHWTSADGVRWMRK